MTMDGSEDRRWRWFVTFGQRYAQESHPVMERFPALHVHPDLVWMLSVSGTSEEDSGQRARAFLGELLGTAWSDLYDTETWAQARDLYPLGCWLSITVPEEGPATLADTRDQGLGESRIEVQLS